MLRTDGTEKATAAAPRGSKQTCESDACGRRFYDLRRSPIACPYCGASVDAHAVVDVDFETVDKRQFSKSSRWGAAPRKPVVEVSKAEDEATDQIADDKDEAAAPENQELLIDIDDEEPDAPVEDNSEAT